MSGASEVKKKSVINSKFISTALWGQTDLDRARTFYEEFLGLEVVRTSPISLFLRLGGEHVYAVVQRKTLTPWTESTTTASMSIATRTWTRLGRRVTSRRRSGASPNHQAGCRAGTYSFHFVDMDGNDWEIPFQPEGRYTWIFEKGDLQGKGHMDRRSGASARTGSKAWRKLNENPWRAGRALARRAAVDRRGSVGLSSKPIRMIVPYPPAGPTDVIGRPMTEKLSAILGQPVILDCSPGRHYRHRYRCGREERTRRLHLAFHHFAHTTLPGTVEEPAVPPA